MGITFKEKSNLSVEDRLDAMEAIIFITRQLVVDKQATLETQISIMEDQLANMTEQLHKAYSLLGTLEAAYQKTPTQAISEGEFYLLKQQVQALRKVFHGTLNNMKIEEYNLPQY